MSKALLGRFLFRLCMTSIVKIDLKGNTIHIIVALISKTIASWRMTVTTSILEISHCHQKAHTKTT